MGAVHVHEFMSLDGVVDNPSWTFEFGFAEEMGARLEAVTSRAAASCSAGRPTRCSSRRGRPGPSRTTPVRRSSTTRRSTSCSGTLTDPTWRNTEVLGAYDPERILRLKDEVGDLYVSGSVSLVRAMLADGLVDELHLCVFPIALGGGTKLFGDGAAPVKFSLAVCESYDNGVAYMNYRTV